MEDVDGSYVDPKGHRKVFTRRRTGESAEHFLARTAAMLEAVGYPLGGSPEGEQ